MSITLGKVGLTDAVYTKGLGAQRGTKTSFTIKKAGLKSNWQKYAVYSI